MSRIIEKVPHVIFAPNFFLGEEETTDRKIRIHTSS